MGHYLLVGALACRIKSPMLTPPTLHRAVTRSKLVVLPLRPLMTVQLACLPKETCSRTFLAAGPWAALISGASKSSIRTSIQSFGSVVLPTHRLSPSPTYRTSPEKVSPCLVGSLASHLSAKAGETRPPRFPA